MNYVIVGVNHNTAPIAVREKLSLTSERVREVLRQIKDVSALKETVVLSTCNRVEIYGVAPERGPTEDFLKDYFSSTLAAGEPSSCLYAKSDKDAVAHLFSVAASLDSLVVGENQITKQVKEAFQLATDNSATGPYLNRLFNRAFFVAKRIKTETEIGKGNVSVGSVGVALAKKIFGSLADKAVLLYGAGEIGELVLKHLHSTTDVGETIIINRSLDKAEALAELGFGVAHPLTELDRDLLKTDILITSLSGGHGGLTKTYFATLMQERRNLPLFIIDLGLPRNVDQSVGEIANVYLYNIDDLKTVADENRGVRCQEIVTAKNIIDEETQLFYESFLGQKALPTIAGLNRKCEDIRQREVSKTLAKLAHLEAADRQNVEELTRAIVAKILHEPILQLKNREELSESPVAAILKKIFSLDDEVNDGK